MTSVIFGGATLIHFLKKNDYLTTRNTDLAWWPFTEQSEVCFFIISGRCLEVIWTLKIRDGTASRTPWPIKNWD